MARPEDAASIALKEASEARRMIEESDSDNSDNDSANEMDEKDKRSGRKAGNGNNNEKPTEEHVERLEEKLEAAQADQKNLFLIIFQVIFILLLRACETVLSKRDIENPI